MEDAVPLHFYRWGLEFFSPEVIIDGETAYNVSLLDSLSFYVASFFILFFLLSIWLDARNSRCFDATAANEGDAARARRSDAIER